MRGKTRRTSSKVADRSVVRLKIRRVCTSLCNAQLRPNLIQRSGKAQVAGSTEYEFDERNQTKTCRRPRQSEIIKRESLCTKNADGFTVLRVHDETFSEVCTRGRQ